MNLVMLHCIKLSIARILGTRIASSHIIVKWTRCCERRCKEEERAVTARLVGL